MTTVTQWFSIQKDGQPTELGWWDAIYGGDVSHIYRRWWDGRNWRTEPSGKITLFGNSEIDLDDCYRGLAVKPKSGISLK